VSEQRPAFASRPRIGPLLDFDPDLGQFLPADRVTEARKALMVGVYRILAGPWTPGRRAVVAPTHLGLLVLDGLIAREVLTEDVISTELLGEGELLRPSCLAPSPRLVHASVRWSVLAETRVAVLDGRATTALGAYPEIVCTLMDRVNSRAERLTLTQAICQLNRVDRRLLTLFWHLAERWGRMTTDGVRVPLTLSHRMLAQLVGARRPTVSTALGELSRGGELLRCPDGSWLLTGEPTGAPLEEIQRQVLPRRKLMAPAVAPPRQPAAAG
jgi:CRP/FNR family cyclic AMP-dependent transcriptional regulator